MKIMPKFNALLGVGSALTLIFLTQGCTSIDEKELYGTYLAEFPNGTEKLILYPSGKYVQEVSIKVKGENKPKILKHSGHWKYDLDDKYVGLDSALNVFNPIDGLNKDYNIPVDGVVLAKVQRTFRSISLSTAYEDIDFAKIK